MANDKKKAIRAILNVVKIVDGEKILEPKMFNTEESVLVCSKTNCHEHSTEDIYLSPKGTLFIQNKQNDTLRIPGQEVTKEWIGEYKPDVYIKHFGEVEEG